MELEKHKFYGDGEGGIYFTVSIYYDPEYLWCDVVKFNQRGGQRAWNSYARRDGTCSNKSYGFKDLIGELDPRSVPSEGWDQEVDINGDKYYVQTIVHTIMEDKDKDKTIQLSGREIWVDSRGIVGLTFPIQGKNQIDGHPDNESSYLSEDGLRSKKQFIFISDNGLKSFVFTEDGVAPHTDVTLVRKIRNSYPIYAGKYLTLGGTEVEVTGVGGDLCNVVYPETIQEQGSNKYVVRLDGRAPHMAHKYDLIRRPGEIWNTGKPITVNTKPVEPQKEFDFDTIKKIMLEIEGNK